MTKGTPANISQLVKDANNKSSWKIRLAALNELKQYDCQQSRDVITRLALHDKVYKVKEEAFRAAQAMGITYRGNPIRLGRKDIGFKTKDFTKVFLRIKREKSMEELDSGCSARNAASFLAQCAALPFQSARPAKRQYAP